MIAWSRICRPGSILGPQQHFLIHNESMLLDAPSIFSKKADEIEEITNLLRITEISGMSKKEQEIAEKGEEGQSTALLDKKRAYYRK